MINRIVSTPSLVSRATAIVCGVAVGLLIAMPMVNAPLFDYAIPYAHAVEPPVQDPVEDVGATPGVLSVGDSGAATYSIPLEVPPGTNQMSPSLSIRYSSGGLSSAYMGVGFGISGLSSISRCQATLGVNNTVRGVRFDDQDRYCLDGMQLILDKNSPQPYGQPGSLYNVEISSGTRPRITLMGDCGGAGACAFKVETLDGSIQYYGATEEVTGNDQKDTENNSQTFYNSPYADIDNDSKVLTYHLARSVDVFGNYMDYVYVKPVISALGIIHVQGVTLPCRIEYTRNLNDGGVLQATRNINFHYNFESLDENDSCKSDLGWAWKDNAAGESEEEANYYNVMLNAGNYASFSGLALQQIEMTIDDSGSGQPADQKTIHTYDFRYEDFKQLPAIKLVSVAECGYGLSDGQKTCRPETTFDWNQQDYAFDRDVANNWDLKVPLLKSTIWGTNVQQQLQHREHVQQDVMNALFIASMVIDFIPGLNTLGSAIGIAFLVYNGAMMVDQYTGNHMENLILGVDNLGKGTYAPGTQHKLNPANFADINGDGFLDLVETPGTYSISHIQCELGLDLASCDFNSPATIDPGGSFLGDSGGFSLVESDLPERFGQVYEPAEIFRYKRGFLSPEDHFANDPFRRAMLGNMYDVDSDGATDWVDALGNVTYADTGKGANGAAQLPGPLFRNVRVFDPDRSPFPWDTKLPDSPDYRYKYSETLPVAKLVDMNGDGLQDYVDGVCTYGMRFPWTAANEGAGVNKHPAAPTATDDTWKMLYFVEKHYDDEDLWWGYPRNHAWPVSAPTDPNQGKCGIYLQRPDGTFQTSAESFLPGPLWTYYSEQADDPDTTNCTHQTVKPEAERRWYDDTCVSKALILNTVGTLRDLNTDGLPEYVYGASRKKPMGGDVSHVDIAAYLQPDNGLPGGTIAELISNHREDSFATVNNNGQFDPASEDTLHLPGTLFRGSNGKWNVADEDTWPSAYHPTSTNYGSWQAAQLVDMNGDGTLDFVNGLCADFGDPYGDDEPTCQVYYGAGVNLSNSNDDPSAFVHVGKMAGNLQFGPVALGLIDSAMDSTDPDAGKKLKKPTDNGLDGLLGFLVDVNGDGALDWTRIDNGGDQACPDDPGNPYNILCSVHFGGTGKGTFSDHFSPEVKGPMPFPKFSLNLDKVTGALSNVMAGTQTDLNGDGVLDYAPAFCEFDSELVKNAEDYQDKIIGEGNVQCDLNAYLSRFKSPRVIAFTDGIGHKKSVEYRPLTDDSIYTRLTETTLDDNFRKPINLRSTRHVVASVAESFHHPLDGEEIEYKTLYHYEGERLHPLYGHLGFRQSTRWSAETGRGQQMVYRQDYPLNGTIETATTFVAPTTVDEKTDCIDMPVSSECIIVVRKANDTDPEDKGLIVTGVVFSKSEGTYDAYPISQGASNGDIYLITNGISAVRSYEYSGGDGVTGSPVVPLPVVSNQKYYNQMVPKDSIYFNWPTRTVSGESSEYNPDSPIQTTALYDLYAEGEFADTGSRYLRLPLGTTVWKGEVLPGALPNDNSWLSKATATYSADLRKMTSTGYFTSDGTTDGELLTTVTEVERDVYGNPVRNVVAPGSGLSSALCTEYDQTFHTFPVRSWRTMDSDCSNASNGTHMSYMRHDPATGNILSSLSPDSILSMAAYDGLGRATKSWAPNPSSPATWVYQPNVTEPYLPIKPEDAVTPQGGPSLILKSSVLRQRPNYDGDGLEIATYAFTGREGEKIQSHSTIVDASGRQIATQWVASDGETHGEVRATLTNYNDRGEVSSRSLPTFVTSPSAFDIPAERFSHYVYDNVGRVVETITPWSTQSGSLEFQTRKTSIGVEQVDGLKTRRIDQVLNPDTPQQQHLSTAMIDKAGRQIRSQKDPDTTDKFTAYRYDEFGRVLGRTDPVGMETTAEYDQLGRLLVHRNVVSGVDLQSYDTVGRVNSRNVNGELIRIEYDNLDRPVLKVLPGGRAVKYVYDSDPSDTADCPGLIIPFPGPDVEKRAQGKLSYAATGRMVDENGEEVFKADQHLIAYTHQPAGFHTRTACFLIDDPLNPETYTEEFDYQYDGMLMTLGYPDGKDLWYDYDNGDFLSSIYRYGENPIADWDNRDVFGNPTKVTYDNGVVTDLEFDDVNGHMLAMKVLSQQGSQAEELLDRFRYSWNNSGQLSDRGREFINGPNGYGIDDHFTHDEFGRLTQAERQIPTAVANYDYDQAGNPSSIQDQIIDQNDQFTMIPDNHQIDIVNGYADRFAYNSQGAMTRKTVTDPDNNQQLLSWLYNFDIEDRLLKVSTVPGIPLVTIVLDGNVRHWSDNSSARSCEEYRRPQVSGYAYTGNTGDGRYRIDPLGNGNSRDVYCDMTTDDGGWTLVAHQANNGGFLEPGWNPNLQADRSYGSYSPDWGARNTSYYANYSDLGDEEFLFKAGDGDRWCAVDSWAVRAPNDSQNILNVYVKASSANTGTLGKTNNLNRGNAEDPWFGCEGPHVNNTGAMLWGENGWDKLPHTSYKNAHDGIGLFVRTKGIAAAGGAGEAGASSEPETVKAEMYYDYTGQRIRKVEHDNPGAIGGHVVTDYVSPTFEITRYIDLLGQDQHVATSYLHGPTGPVKIISEDWEPPVVGGGLVTIVLDGNVRHWSDNSSARSCEEYRRPQVSGYAYTGNTGDGRYRIDPLANGNSRDVYCDMTTDDGGWTLVAHQANNGGFLEPGWNPNLQADRSYGSYSPDWGARNTSYYANYSDLGDEEFLFKAGDGDRWCAVDSAAVRTSNTDLYALNIEVNAASANTAVQAGGMTNNLNRGKEEDPWFGCEGAHVNNTGAMLWGENGWYKLPHISYKNAHDGIGLFVRTKGAAVAMASAHPMDRGADMKMLAGSSGGGAAQKVGSSIDGEFIRAALPPIFGGLVILWWSWLLYRAGGPTGTVGRSRRRLALVLYRYKLLSASHARALARQRATMFMIDHQLLRHATPAILLSILIYGNFYSEPAQASLDSGGGLPVIGQTLYVNANISGGTALLTDEHGVQVTRIGYRGYGNLDNTVSSGPDEIRYKFQDKEFDTSTGLYYYDARYLDPQLARFSSVDPAAQSSSPYMALLSDPSSHIDPSGMAAGGESVLTASDFSMKFMEDSMVSRTTKYASRVVLGAVLGALAVKSRSDKSTGANVGLHVLGGVVGAGTALLGVFIGDFVFFWMPLEAEVEVPVATGSGPGSISVVSTETKRVFGLFAKTHVESGKESVVRSLYAAGAGPYFLGTGVQILLNSLIFGGLNSGVDNKSGKTNILDGFVSSSLMSIAVILLPAFGLYTLGAYAKLGDSIYSAKDFTGVSISLKGDQIIGKALADVKSDAGADPAIKLTPTGGLVDNDANRNFVLAKMAPDARSKLARRIAIELLVTGSIGAAAGSCMIVTACKKLKPSNW